MNTHSIEILFSLLYRGELKVLWVQPVHEEGHQGWEQGWLRFPLLQWQQVQVLDLRPKVRKAFFFFFNFPHSGCPSAGWRLLTRGKVCRQRAQCQGRKHAGHRVIFYPIWNTSKSCRCVTGGSRDFSYKWGVDISELPPELSQLSSSKENYWSSKGQCCQHSLHRLWGGILESDWPWLRRADRWWWHAVETDPFHRTRKRKHHQRHRNSSCAFSHRS